MRKAALVYNPTSGSKWQNRMRRIEAAAEVLRSANVVVVPVATTGPGTAGMQAREAVARGCDTVIACGGDGTVHDILQGLVGTEAAIGVIPLGTANALAWDLHMPRDPRRAAQVLLDAEVRRIAAGRIEYRDRAGQSQSRYFTVAAGIGADAHLAYKLSAEFKRTHGMGAYYAKATQLWMTHSFPAFEVRFCDPQTHTARTEIVTELLAIRITDFGGILRRMAPRAALQRDNLELVLFKTRNRIDYLRFVLGNMFGRASSRSEIEFVTAERVECRPLAQDTQRGGPVYAEADGEMLGLIPASVDLVPQAFNLLMPRSHPNAV